MKAYELMALAEKEPTKYAGRTYKIVHGCAIRATSERETHCFNGIMVDGNGELIGVTDGKVTIYLAYVSSGVEVEEIPQDVPFMEAVKAYSEGRTIFVERDGKKRTYEDSCYCGFFEANDILYGKWYIQD